MHEFTKERLDMDMVNQVVLNLIVDVTCNIILDIKSDHTPLPINIRSRGMNRQRHPYFLHMKLPEKLERDVPI